MMAKRHVIEDPSLPKHKNPIPTCVRIGNMVFSSAISGQDPQTRTVPPDPEQQVTQAFTNMQKIVEAAGGTTDNIAKVLVYLKDLTHREFVNTQWLKMFPHDNDRPARHAVKADLPRELVIQLEFIAVL